MFILRLRNRHYCQLNRGAVYKNKTALVIKEMGFLAGERDLINQTGRLFVLAPVAAESQFKNAKIKV